MEDDPNKEFSAAEPQEVPSTYEKLEEDYDIDEEITDEEDDRDFEAVEKPAMVINVQSWAIPIIGLVMLLVGIAAGYAGREIVASLTRENAVPSVTEAASAESIDIPAGEVVALPSITPQQPSAEEQEELMTFLVSQTKHFIGEADAPVTIIEFSDFQWPFCGRFAADAGRQIKETYVEDGSVRFGYFHFAFLGEESVWAAEASECAADQDAFWEYHDLLFERQAGENQGAFNKDNLKEFAAELELDTDAFNECMDSGKYTELVNAQKSTAQQLGVRSTPTFAVNGQAVVGAQPFENFQQVIDNELNSE